MAGALAVWIPGGSESSGSPSMGLKTENFTDDQIISVGREVPRRPSCRKDAQGFCSRSSAAGSGAIAFDHPLPTGRAVYEMAVMMTRQERQFEPSMCRVLGANKKPKAESADRESPSRGVIAAPMADEPGEDEGDQPDATNPHEVMPHRRI